MKPYIQEIIEICHPQSLIQRRYTPTSELINTSELIDEINNYLQLPLSDEVDEEPDTCPACEKGYNTDFGCTNEYCERYFEGFGR